jgi:cytochrome c oxidase cbb3-type subunit III
MEVGAMFKQSILYVLILFTNLLFTPEAWASTSVNPDRHVVTDTIKAPLLIHESPYSLIDTVEQVKRAITGQNYKLIRQQTLDRDSDANQQSAVKEIILYFCNFNKLDMALKLDKRAGLFLPCRISIIERDGKVYMMTVNPKEFNSLFQNQKLDKLCEELYQDYLTILEEASL